MTPDRIAPSRAEEDGHSLRVPAVEELRRRISAAHPRLFYRPGDFARLAAQWTRPPFAEHQAAVRKAADQHLGRPLPAIEVPRGFYATYRAQSPEAVRIHLATQGPVEANMEALRNSTLIYRVTGDRRYLEQSLAAMRALAAIDPVDTSYKVTHCFCHLIPALSLGLDWLWDELDPADRDRVSAVLLQRTRDFFPLSLQIALQNPLDSHAWEYGLFGMTYAALALYHHHPEAEAWLQTVLTFLEYGFPGFGGDDGGWGQGIGYGADTDVQLVMHLLFVGAGVNFFDTPWARNSGNLRLYFQPPYGRCPTFGDASYLHRPGLQKQVMQIYAMVHQNPYYQWYADQIDAPFFGGGYFFSHEYFLSHFLYWTKPPAKPPADLPPAAHVRDIDWVALHTDLADRDRNVMLLFKSSHFGSFNHSHADQNSFVLEAFGQPLLIDSGYYPWYGSEHDVVWSRQTRAHNALLINGRGQGVWNRAAAGRIAAFQSTADFAYTAGDATAAYQQPSRDAPAELCAAGEGVVRAVRHIVFVRPDVFVILDDIETRQPAALQLLLHAPQAVQLDATRRMATSLNGAAAARVCLPGTDSVAMTQTDQFTDATGTRSIPPENIVVWDESRSGVNQWHVTCEFAATTAIRRLLTVIQVYRPSHAGQLPAVERVELPRTIGVKVGAARVLFHLNPAAVKVSCRRAKPDGYVVEFEQSGPPTA